MADEAAKQLPGDSKVVDDAAEEVWPPGAAITGNPERLAAQDGGSTPNARFQLESMNRTFACLAVSDLDIRE